MIPPPRPAKLAVATWHLALTEIIPLLPAPGHLSADSLTSFRIGLFAFVSHYGRTGAALLTLQATYRVSRTHDNRRRGYCKAGYQQISNVLCLLASRTNPKMCKNDASSYYSNIALLIRISTAPKNGAFLPSCSVRSTPHAVHQYTPVGGTVPNTLIYK